jgi:hypothetical protein
LWWIGIFRHERKREANRRSSLRAANHKIKNEYLDLFADAIECHGSCRYLDYRKVTTSELQEFFAEETLCQGKFPSNAILPPLRAALPLTNAVYASTSYGQDLLSPCGDVERLIHWRCEEALP